MYNKPVNSVRLAFGTASYCKTCRALMAGGVNNPEVAKSLGINGPKQWDKFLRDHEAYHKAKGEELPDSYTVRGFSEEMKAMVAAKPEPKVSVAVVRQFVKQTNGRQDNRPVIKPLNTTPFAGFR